MADLKFLDKEGFDEAFQYYEGKRKAEVATKTKLGRVKIGNGINVSNDGEISVDAVVSMTIITPPTKTQYRIGESFNPAGMVARITRSDGTTQDVSSGFIFCEEKFTHYGPRAFKVGYEDVNTVYTTVNLTVNVIYGFVIKGSESFPGTMVHYIEDAKNMHPAHMDFASGIFDWGDWKDAFFIPRPCMLRSDGTVAYYLDPDDYTLKEDGTYSDIANASFDGNAMIEWGQNGTKIWYKVEQGNSTKDGKVFIAPYQVDNTYHAWSFINNQGVLVDHFYTPIYNGVSVSGKLRSLSGYDYGSLIQSKTATEEIALARANNPPGQMLWDTEVFADIQIINFLLILMGKSLDTQGTFGYGRYDGTTSPAGMISTGTMDGRGLFWGHNSGTYGVKVFGMENWWGNQWRRYCGHINANGTQKIKLTHGTQDGSTASDYNTDGSGYITISNATPDGSSGGYISEMKFDQYGMHPKTASGSSSTYFCDGLWFNNGLTDYAYRGGDCGVDLRVGAFSCILSVHALVAVWFVGASLSCKPLA